MNSIIIRRIAWKEYRQQLVFFAALVMLALALQLLAAWLLSAGVRVPGSGFDMNFGILGGFAALFAVACGATLYATEKEMGTFQNLQLLPLTSRQLLAGKLMAAVPLCAGFLLIAAIVTALIAGAFGAGAEFNVGFCLLFFGLAVVECFAWAWLFSLISQRPLVAAVLGVFTASAMVQISVRLVNGAVYDAFAVEPYQAAWQLRLVIAAAVLLVDVVIARTWLDGRRVRASREVVRSSESARGETAKVGTWAMACRLVWQTYRTSWGLMLTYVALVAGSIAIGFADPWFLILSGGFLTLLASCLAGVFVFQPDQARRSHQFLTSVGERATLVWACRLFSWLTVILAVHVTVALICFAVLNMTLGREYTALLPVILFATHNPEHWLAAAGSYGLIISIVTTWSIASIATFSAGQLASLLFRSSIIAGLAGLVAGAALMLWCVLMSLAAAPWWTVIPLSAAFFMASWLGMRPWLAERGVLARMLLPIAVPTVTSVVVLLATMNYRATEIPAIDVNLAIVFDGPFRASARGRVNPEVIDEIRERYVTALEDYRPIEEFVLGPSDGVLYQFRNPYRTEPPELSDEHVQATRNYLAANAGVIEKVCQAIDFGQQNIDELKKLPPYFRRQTEFPLQPPPISVATFGSIQELLSPAVWLSLEVDVSLEESWKNLRSLVQLNEQFGLHYPQRASAGPYRLISLWASRPQQTSETLMAAVELLQQDDWLLSTNLRRLEAERNEMIHRIDTADLRTSSNNSGLVKYASKLRPLALRHLPCERERARRLIDLITAVNIPTVLYAENGYASLEPAARTVSWTRQNLDRDVRRKLDLLWPSTTIWPLQEARSQDSAYYALLGESDRYRDNRGRYNYFLSERIRDEQLRRMTILKLSLLAYEKEHGELPEDLDAILPTLTPDEWTVPGLDRPFAYSPGLDGPIAVRAGSGWKVAIPANTPFLTNRDIPWHTNEVYIGPDYDESGVFIEVSKREVISAYVLPSSGETTYGSEIMPIKSEASLLILDR